MLDFGYGRIYLAVKFSVHPLFFLFGIYYALTGRIFLFLIYTLSALVHEFGHFVFSYRRGVCLDKITLMPFGAVAKGDVDGLNVKDRIAVALGGPIVNFFICVGVIALWWLYPDTYAFTDTVVEANLSLLLVNLIPVFPLDGGRIVHAIFSESKNKEVADKISKVLSGVLALGLFALFIVSAFYSLNLSFLFFSLFTLFGAFGKSKDNKYVRVYLGINPKLIKNGAKIKRYAISVDTKVKKLLALCDSLSVNEFTVFDGDKAIGVISQEKLRYILEKGDLYGSVSEYL